MPNQVRENRPLLNGEGFTLIELLVVVLIIGILAAVALPKYEMAVMRSRYATLKANVNALMNAEEIYHMANGEYTGDMEALAIDLTGCTLSGNKRVCTYPWGQCGINVTVNRLYCEDTRNLQNGYALYWERSDVGTEVCWSFSSTNSDKYGKLCQKEGGTFLGQAPCTHNPCNVFRIRE